MSKLSTFKNTNNNALKHGRAYARPLAWRYVSKEN